MTAPTKQGPKSRATLKLMQTHGALTVADLIRLTGWTLKDARTVMHALRKRAWISSEWIEGTKSKVYALTNMGFATLELEAQGVYSRQPRDVGVPLTRQFDVAAVVQQQPNSVFQLGQK